MAYNPNWPKWIQASIAKHFKTVANNNNYVSLVEELEERTTEFMEASDRIEIRMNGPFVKNQSANYYLLEIDANILIFSHMDETSENVYDGIDIAGVMAQAASGPIPVYRLGNSIDDDGEQIGCLTLSRDGVKVFHFGEITRQDRLRQFSVDAGYKLEIFN